MTQQLNNNKELSYLNEVKSDRERQIYDFTYMWNIKNTAKELIYKTERLTDIEKLIYGYKGESRRRIN